MGLDRSMDIACEGFGVHKRFVWRDTANGPGSLWLSLAAPRTVPRTAARAS